MGDPKPQPKQGDPCPACDGELKVLRALTPEEYAQSRDKENPKNFGPAVDTAAPEFVAEHGALAKCRECGYTTRFAPETADEARASERSRRREKAPAAAGASKE